MDAARLAAAESFSIGDFVVHPARRVIVRSGAEHHLEPKVMSVLLDLAARRGVVVDRSDIIDRIWEMEAGADESLTRAISLLRKIFTAAPGGRGYIETVRKRGYRLTATIAPAGKVENEACVPVGEMQPAAPPAGGGKTAGARMRPLVISVATVGAAVALAVFIAAIGQGGGNWIAPVETQHGRVEVRAFDVLSGDAQARGFANGLHDAMIRVLTGSGVETASPASSTPSPGGAVRSSEFAVTGSVDRNGEEYLVTVNIEERKKEGLTVWSSQFKQAGDAPLALQTRIAAKAASVLRCGLAYRAPHIGHSQMTPQVFSLFLQECALFGDGVGANNGSLFVMHDLSRRLVDAAPDLAESHGFLAASNAYMGRAAAAGSGEAEAYFTEARKEAARALELNPQSGNPYFALAVASPQRAEHEAYLRKIKPHDASYEYALTMLTYQMRATGRVEEATVLLRRAHAIDPYTPLRPAALAWVLANEGKLREADALLDRTESLRPNSLSLKSYRLNIAVWRKPPDVAMSILSAPDAFPSDMSNAEIECFRALVDARRQGTLGAFADRTAGSSCLGPQQAEYLARLYAMNGDIDAAWRELERINFGWDFGSTVFLFFPEMQAVRRDRRFMSLAARSGLVDYWLEADRWPDFCAEPDLPYDCRNAAEAAASARL